jgi:hypothetical protein
MKHILSFLFFIVSCLHAAETNSLFTLKDLGGVSGIYASNGNPLAKPDISADAIDQVIIQSVKADGAPPKFILVHNNGTSDLTLIRGEKSWTFFEVLGDSNFMYTICFDVVFEDGNFLVITTGVRTGFMGQTSTRVFSGKARPSPFLNSLLNSK